MIDPFANLAASRLSGNQSQPDTKYNPFGGSITGGPSNPGPQQATSAPPTQPFGLVNLDAGSLANSNSSATAAAENAIKNPFASKMGMQPTTSNKFQWDSAKPAQPLTLSQMASQKASGPSSMNQQPMPAMGMNGAPMYGQPMYNPNVPAQYSQPGSFAQPQQASGFMPQGNYGYNQSVGQQPGPNQFGAPMGGNQPFAQNQPGNQDPNQRKMYGNQSNNTSFF